MLSEWQHSDRNFKFSSRQYPLYSVDFNEYKSIYQTYYNHNHSTQRGKIIHLPIKERKKMG